MRLIHALIDIKYSGRGDTRISGVNGLIMVKADGSISIHYDRKYAPLNYMPSTISITEEDNILIAESKTESLRIKILEKYAEYYLNLDDRDLKLVRKGTEEDLHYFLKDYLTSLRNELTFKQLEYQTPDGFVDILAQDINTNELVLIEVKRIATKSAVHQLRRYIEAEKEIHSNIKGFVAALDFKDDVQPLADKHGYGLIRIPEDYSDWKDPEL